MFNDIQQWQIVQLASNGGFANRFIAAHVLGKRPNEVEDYEVRGVQHVLKRHAIRLRDWRNGETQLAKHHVRAVAQKKKHPAVSQSNRRRAG